MNYKGQYSDTLMYAPGDVVTWLGSSFVALRMNQSVLPNTSGMWAMIAAAGRAGDPGKDGRSGQDGAVGPGVAPGGIAGQVLVKSGTGEYDTAWRDYSPSAIGAARASHQHSMEDIAALTDIVGGKANKSHTHPCDQISDLEDRLKAFALMSHGHSGADIRGGNVDVDVVETAIINIDATTITESVIDSKIPMRHSINGVPELIINQGSVRISNTATVGSIVIRGGRPTSSTANGMQGEVRVSDTHLYVCVENNKWKRIPLQDW